MGAALQKVQSRLSDLEFKSMITGDGDKLIRLHKIEWVAKITLALTCLIFFFIGAPLGAIIRKGGLGLPVLISVLVFIVYYILDNSGYRMARGGMWTIWFGKGLAPAVLVPMAVFFTYKATNDSVVFNMDLYADIFRRFFGLRVKRPIYRKEVVINDPNYAEDLELSTYPAFIVYFFQYSSINYLYFHKYPTRNLKKEKSQLHILIRSNLSYLFSNRESTKSFLLNSCRASIDSPRPIYFTGTLS